MSNIELRITWKDWISVFIIGISFSSLLSILIYYLLALSLRDGFYFGVILGSFIGFFSMFFVSTMNSFFLPKINKKWWNTSAALFSFLSGALGSYFTYWSTKIFSFQSVPLFITNPYKSSLLLGLLTYFIGALIYRFVKTRNEKEYINQLFTRSRMASLQTQLNPHFLHNALNSLAELIHQNPFKAEEAVLKISSFLRNTMHESPLITLKEETKNVQDYIDLENIRFDNTIQLKVDIDSSLMAINVPKFSTQLLCENAIKHGMFHQEKNSFFIINISVYKNKEGLYIDVTNNGKKVENSNFGIGLSNLQERLKYLCNGNISIISVYPVHYRIQLGECNEHINC